MKIFLLDLWTDLREKRLWPVALVLLAALVAAPVVLSKKAEDAPVAPAAPAADNKEPDRPEGPAQLAQVKLEELSGSSGSSLSSFDPSNPFAPPQKVLEAARREAGGASDSSDATVVDGGGVAVDGGGDTGTTTGGGFTGDTGGGDTGDTGGGDTGGDDTGGTTTTEYTYVLDVTFSANGRTRKIKGLRKLDMLPNAASPLLIFLGVTENAGNGVFLVDSSLTGAGEGSCRPSDEECAFLYIGAGSEHEFTNEDGESYTIRVDEIRRVKVGAKASASKKSKTKTKSAKAAVGRDATRRPASKRRFVLPFLADLVSVSSGGRNNSNSDRDRR